MSTYYEFSGSLSFAKRADAANALAKLRGDGGVDTIFWLPKSVQENATDLVLDNRTITFDSKGHANAEPLDSARAAVAAIAERAIAGQVRVQEGDGGPGTRVDHYGLAPTKEKEKTKTASVKKKTAVKAKTKTKTKKR